METSLISIVCKVDFVQLWCNRGNCFVFNFSNLFFASISVIIFLLTFIDWRNIWIAISISVIIILPLVIVTLVKNVKLDSRETSSTTKIKTKDIKQWTRSEVLKDYRFYIICLSMLAMPWIATGTFVYQSFIVSSKNWGPYVIAQSFMVYSILSVFSSFSLNIIYIKHIYFFKYF